MGKLTQKQSNACQSFVEKSLPAFLTMFEQQLESSKTSKFLFDTQKVSVADFYLFYLLHVLQDWKVNVLNNFPKIGNFYQEMLKDEKIKARHEKESKLCWCS